MALRGTAVPLDYFLYDKSAERKKREEREERREKERGRKDCGRVVRRLNVVMEHVFQPVLKRKHLREENGFKK